MEEEARTERRQERLKEIAHAQRLRAVNDSVKAERLASAITLQACSASIRDYYQRIDAKDLSKHIKQRFIAADFDSSGALDKGEVTEAMASMGKRPSPEEVDQLMENVDTDRNGTVELDEFEHMVRASLPHPLSISHSLSLSLTRCLSRTRIRTRADQPPASQVRLGGITGVPRS